MVWKQRAKVRLLALMQTLSEGSLEVVEAFVAVEQEALGVFWLARAEVCSSRTGQQLPTFLFLTGTGAATFKQWFPSLYNAEQKGENKKGCVSACAAYKNCRNREPVSNFDTWRLFSGWRSSIMFSTALFFVYNQKLVTARRGCLRAYLPSLSTEKNLRVYGLELTWHWFWHKMPNRSSAQMHPMRDLTFAKWSATNGSTMCKNYWHTPIAQWSPFSSSFHMLSNPSNLNFTVSWKRREQKMEAFLVILGIPKAGRDEPRRQMVRVLW